MIDRQQVNLRLERELVDSLDDLAQDAHVDRTEVARRILTEGIARARMERAVRDYASGQASAWKAARRAGVSLYEMLDAVHEAGIPYEPDPEDLTAAGSGGGSRRVAEVSPGYGGDDAPAASEDIAGLRERFRPAAVRVLLVGESSPVGGTHFYLANSNLFRATCAAFVTALGADAVPDGASFLPWFRDRGWWLVDIAEVPVNQLSNAARHDAVEAGVQPLAATLRRVSPGQVVAVKRDIEGPVQRAMALAGIDVPLSTLPFPVRQWRPIYERDLAELIRGDFTGRSR